MIPRQRCTYCGATTHTREHCPSTYTGVGNRCRMRCSYCGSDRHYRDACPKTVAAHRRPPHRYVRD